jgi:hypothetical protein
VATGFKDFAAGNVLAAADLDDYCVRQVVMQFASDAARDSALSGVLREGMMCTTLDNNRTYWYNLSTTSWEVDNEPPQAWTPVITQGATPTFTLLAGWYKRSRGVFTAQATMQLTSAGTATNTITISTPVTLANAEYVGGSVQVYDSSVTTLYHGYATPSSTTVFVAMQAGATAATGIGNNPAVTLASGDQIRVAITGRFL